MKSLGSAYRLEYMQSSVVESRDVDILHRCLLHSSCERGEKRPSPKDPHAQCRHMSGCQHDGPFLGTLNIRCCIITGIQKGTITHTYSIYSSSVRAYQQGPNTQTSSETARRLVQSGKDLPFMKQQLGQAEESPARLQFMGW